MKLLIFLFCFLSVAMPLRIDAAYYTHTAALSTHVATSIAQVDYLQRGGDKYRHMQHFRGARHTFLGVFALTCSIIGSAAVITCLAAAIATTPTAAFIAAAYGFNLLGIVAGIFSANDTAGSTAIFLGLGNLLVLFVGAAIYDAAMGNFTALAKLLTMFARH